MNLHKLFLYQNYNGNFYRKINANINVILVLHQLFILCSEAYYLDNNPYRHKQILGPKASFVVEWSVNWKERAVLFQVSAETKGWLGFGLSRDGRMEFSDAVIGGVDSFSGKPYFNDVHIKSNRSVQIDEQQDWKLIGAWEKGKRTYLSFTRAMDTCDNQDYPITKDLVVLIWAYGETDDLQYHMKRRGSVPVYLLDPSISDELAHDHYRQIGPHSNLYLAQRWAVTNKIRISARPSSVWCSLERGPTLSNMHGIVGMGALLPTKLARQHVQQMLLYKCTSPQQVEAQVFFEPFTRLTGEECFLNEKRTLPLSMCRELIYVWSRGGKPFYFPEDIGIPIGESQNEYYLLETHIDNPKGKSDVDIEAGIEIAFSHRQRSRVASLLQIGYGPLGIFMIPPQTKMSIYGSCGPACTSAMFPKNGANIFAAMLHSRSLGRSIRLKHFRGGNTELPWVIKDDNYDSEFQQMRLFSKEVTVLPGDQLVTECTFDSTERNRTSFSGFSSHDEVCSAFVYVSEKMPFFRCTSELPADQLLSRYGIRNFTWDLNWQDRFVTFPKHMEGTWMGDVIDNESQLSKLNNEQLQQDFKYSSHLASCPNINDMIGLSKKQALGSFLNNGQQLQSVPVATKTPHLTSTVSYPKVNREYRETPFCQALQHENPNGLNKIVAAKVLGSRLPFPIKDAFLNAVPPPPPPSNPPLQHDIFNSFGNINRPNNYPPSGSSVHIPPSPPQPPMAFNNFLPGNSLLPSVVSDDRIPVPPSPPPPPPPPFGSNFLPGNSLLLSVVSDDRIPVPPSPPPPPPRTVSTKNRGSRTKKPSGSAALPIPPGAVSPPVLSQDYRNFNSGRKKNRNKPTSVGLRIPMVQTKQPDPSTDKSILNFFEQIANIFSSSSPKKNTQNNIRQDGYSFHQFVDMSNNLLKKRRIGA